MGPRIDYYNGICPSKRLPMQHLALFNLHAFSSSVMSGDTCLTHNKRLFTSRAMTAKRFVTAKGLLPLSLQRNMKNLLTLSVTPSAFRPVAMGWMSELGSAWASSLQATSNTMIP